LQLGNGSGYLNRFGSGPQFKPSIHTKDIGNLKYDPAPDRPLESSRVQHDFVITGNQVDGCILAGVIGYRFELCTRRGIQYGNLRRYDGSAGRVGQSACDGAAIQLAETR